MPSRTFVVQLVVRVGSRGPHPLHHTTSCQHTGINPRRTEHCSRRYHTHCRQRQQHGLQWQRQHPCQRWHPRCCGLPHRRHQRLARRWISAEHSRYLILHLLRHIFGAAAVLHGSAASHPRAREVSLTQRRRLPVMPLGMCRHRARARGRLATKMAVCHRKR